MYGIEQTNVVDAIKISFNMNRFEIRSVQVTSEDIAGAGSKGVGDPFAIALRRVTGTRWKMSVWGVALEMTAPYRTLVLPGPALRAWQIYQQSGTVEPLEFIAEICTPDSDQMP